jgi:hypothetical protein
VYDDEIAALDKRRKGLDNGGMETTAVKDDMQARNTMSRNYEELTTSHVIDEL